MWTAPPQLAAGPDSSPTRSTATRRISNARARPVTPSPHRPGVRHVSDTCLTPRMWREQATESQQHYSYTMYADKAMARSFEDRRFGGPIGELVSSTQVRVLANMIGRIKDRTIIDVGTGAGRAALMLALGGAKVTAVGTCQGMPLAPPSAS